jgi:hypothetical protein
VKRYGEAVFGKPSVWILFLSSTGRRSGGRDALEIIEQDENRITITDIVRLYSCELSDLNLLHRATQLQALPAS